jgi:hypothetical protein
MKLKTVPESVKKLEMYRTLQLKALSPITFMNLPEPKKKGNDPMRRINENATSPAPMETMKIFDL